MDELVAASKPLRYNLLEEALTPLEDLLQNFPALQLSVVEYKIQRTKARRIEKAAPWLVVLVTIILCYLIFSIT